MSAMLTEIEKLALADSLYLGQELVREADVQILLDWAAGIRLRAHLLQEVLAGKLFPAVNEEVPGMEAVSFFTLPWTVDKGRCQLTEWESLASLVEVKAIADSLADAGRYLRRKLEVC